MNELTSEQKQALVEDSNTRVKQLEQYIAQAEQVDLQTTHALSGKCYARTIFIPAGTVLTGAVHKRDHVNIVCGDISVTTDDGVKRLTGYHVIQTKAGMKRAGFAHADTYWTTVCHTELEVIEEIEEELVEDANRLQTRNLNRIQDTKVGDLICHSES